MLRRWEWPLRSPMSDFGWTQERCCPIYKAHAISSVPHPPFPVTTIMIFFLLLASVCSLFSLVYAVPIVSPVKRDVWVPPITYPVSTTVWAAGCTYNVTWDTSSKPVNVTNSVGQVYLRRNGATEDRPIAQGFNLTDGTVNVTIPINTVSDTDWMVVRKSIL